MSTFREEDQQRNQEWWHRQHRALQSIARMLSGGIHEPARERYFFSRWLHDFLTVLEKTFAYNTESLEWLKSWLNADFFILRLLYGVIWAVVWVLGGMWLAMLFTVAAVIWLFTFFVFFLLKWTVSQTERIYRGVWGLFSACPECHQKTGLPIYVCDMCGEKHRRLVPSMRYGITRRFCLCGRRLGTTPFSGRGKLAAICSSCGKDLGTHVDEVELRAFPIVGGPGVGKTAFLMASMQALSRQVAPENGWKMRFPFPGDEAVAQRVHEQMRQGISPMKTSKKLPTAFCAELESGRWVFPQRLYFYDPAGEAFSDRMSLFAHHYYQFMKGIIFLIDPFSIPDVARRYASRMEEAGGQTHFSTASAEQCCERLFISLESDHQASMTGSLSIPCAVVITKIDMFDLFKQIGTPDIGSLARQRGVSHRKVMDTLCRNFLLQNNMGNLLGMLESRFSVTGYFAVSAFRKTPGAEEYSSWGMDWPITWLLKESFF